MFVESYPLVSVGCSALFFDNFAMSATNLNSNEGEYYIEIDTLVEYCAIVLQVEGAESRLESHV